MLRSIACQTRAGGSTPGSASIIRPSRRSQSSASWQNTASSLRRRSNRRLALPRKVPSTYSPANRRRISGSRLVIGQALVEARKAAPDPALHRADRRRQPFGQLDMGQTLEIGERDGPALALVEPLKTARQGARGAALHHLLQRIRV